MADTSQFLSIKKLKGRGIILVAAKHNLRELQAELGAGSRIDARRMCLNVVLAGAPTAQAVHAAAIELMAQAGIDAEKLAKNTVFGIEAVVSLPPASNVNHDDYFADALAFVAGRLPVPVLSAVLHNDEAAPHLHVLLLPIVDGRMAGSDLLGGPPQFRALQTAFFAEVGAKHGLIRQKAVMRLTPETSLKFAEIIANTLDCPAIDDNPARLPALINALRRSPGLPELIESWGMSLPAGGRTFAEIMTATATPEKSNPIWFERKRNPIGLSPALVETLVKEQTISCVGFADSDAHKAAPASDDGQQIEPATPQTATPTDDAKEAHLVRTTATDTCAPMRTLTATDATTLPGSAESTATTTETPADSNAPTTASESPDVPATHYGQGRGRKAKVVDVTIAMRMRAGGMSMNSVAEYFDCKKSTLYKLLPHPSRTLAQQQQPQLFG